MDKNTLFILLVSALVIYFFILKKPTEGFVRCTNASSKSGLTSCNGTIKTYYNGDRVYCDNGACSKP